MHQARVIETERLLLRPLEDSDIDELVVLDNDPEVMRHLTGGKSRTRTEVVEDYGRRLQSGDYWGASEKPDGQFLGWFSLGRSAATPDARELGYRLHKWAWGHGLASEGSRALLRLGFRELGVKRVWAQTMAVNARSRAVMARLGMKHIRTFHPRFDDPIPGTEQGEVVYEITRDAWEASNLARERPADPS